MWMCPESFCDKITAFSELLWIMYMYGQKLGTNYTFVKKKVKSNYSKGWFSSSLSFEARG